ncbi:hypothetical protein ACB361_07000 [Escherichia coli]
MKEIVRQTPELREAVYSLINRDVERALSGLESVKPSQVPRQEGAWAPEHSVTGVQSQPGSETGRSAAEGDAERRGFPGYPHDTV